MYYQKYAYQQKIYYKTDKYQIITKKAEDDIVSSDPEFQAGVASIVGVVVEGGQVLQGRPVAELVLVLT